MKRSAEKKDAKGVVALALTWDGARWPMRGLTPKARAFLAGASRKIISPSAAQMAKSLALDEVNEIRVCWVPRLKGGKKVLSEPFAPTAGKRIAFKTAESMLLGEVMGVIYRKN